MATATEPGTEIATVDEHEQLPATVETAEKSAGDCRDESIARTLDAAYAKASTLQLTQEEATALAEDFPDEAFRTGARGNFNLIYIEHAYLRQRLNQVLGVGAAVPIRRREWTEPFRYWKEMRNDEGGEWREAVRIYVDLVLLVRGCVVGEAIADSTYFPDNDAMTYSDALESAKSDAFRRCCKEFGVGLQAWMKGWGEGWKERNGSGKQAGSARSTTKQQAQPAKQQTSTQPKSTVKPPTDWPATSYHDLTKWLDTLTHIVAVKEALTIVLAAKLDPPVAFGAITAVHTRYHALLSTVSDGERKKAEALTKWVDAELAKAEKANLDAQGKETFGDKPDVFTPPPAWPDTSAADLIEWTGKLSSIAAVKTATGLFLNEPSLQQVLPDWEATVTAVAARYKALTKNFTTNRDGDLEAQISAAIAQLQADKKAAE